MNILVNATATRTGGGLSVFNQFIDNIPIDTKDIYFVFVSPWHVKKEKDYIVYVEKDTASWIKRIVWDGCGLKKWIRKKRLKVDLFISFQNTSSNLSKKIPQLIYYHQQLALGDYKWNFFSKQERILFLYEKIYPYFISYYLTKFTHVVVQTSFVKRDFIQRFCLLDEQVHVIPPAVDSINSKWIDTIDFDDNNIHILYPATSQIYKNHKIIIKALSVLRNKNLKLFLKIRVHFTLDNFSDKKLYSLIKQEQCVENVVFEGILTHERLLSFYKSCNLLLFPSYIETLGLPLLEAAAVGLPIIASDLPYAQEALEGYEGVFLIDHTNVELWADMIQAACDFPRRYSPFIYERNAWNDFFDLVDTLK